MVHHPWSAERCQAWCILSFSGIPQFNAHITLLGINDHLQPTSIKSEWVIWWSSDCKATQLINPYNNINTTYRQEAPVVCHPALAVIVWMESVSGWLLTAMELSYIRTYINHFHLNSVAIGGNHVAEKAIWIVTSLCVGYNYSKSNFMWWTLLHPSATLYRVWMGRLPIICFRSHFQNASQCSYYSGSCNAWTWLLNGWESST
jgi:hypothetical protein